LSTHNQASYRNARCSLWSSSRFSPKFYELRITEAVGGGNMIDC